MKAFVLKTHYIPATIEVRGTGWPQNEWLKKSLCIRDRIVEMTAGDSISEAVFVDSAVIQSLKL